MQTRQVVWAAGLLAAATLTPAANAQAPVNIRIQTTIALPNGGSVVVGSYAQVSDSRSEFGPPGLSGVPYLNRPVRNVGYGRSTTAGQVRVSARIIDLREEEYRQTGFRSP
jgi:type II secretory pathway component GspD/PulD (secretin)